MEAKPCALISVIPASLQPGWARSLAEFTKSFKPAALILKDLDPGPASQIIREAQSLDLAVLFADAAEDVQRMKASGVFFYNAQADVAKARTALGSAAIIGAACGLSRHTSMESAEAGADFIAFDASCPEKREEAAELSLWWDEITGVPVALDCGRLRAGSSLLLEARPDFLLIEEEALAGESLTFATEFGLQSQV